LFIVLSAVMLTAAVVWLILPLLRPQPTVDVITTRRERRVASMLTAVFVCAIAIGMYLHVSNWDWNAAPAVAATTNQESEQLLGQLEAKLKENPQDVTGWLLLARSYAATEQFPRARDAYQRAYDLTRGENPEALIGLGESLAMIDETALRGRAGQLFDRALQLAPNHPKALWYGSMAALQAGDLQTGRDRLKRLLAQNPPEQLRGILERQVQDLEQQLAMSGQGAPAAAAASGNSDAAAAQRVIRVAVTLAPALAKQVDKQTALFVLARDPQAPGPPLAVQRRTAAELPLTIELSERDAMLPSRTIATVPRVQVVARLSSSGTPLAQSGDFYGQADYDFASESGTLNIVIDQRVP
jgi:cytochrome c-type biogenesis protein CcmH